MALVRDTVAIPVAKGIDVNTPDRLVDAQELLEAQNVRFMASFGARKRRGHLGQKVRGAKALPAEWVPPVFSKSTFTTSFSTDDRALDSDWLFGYGYVTDDSTVDPTVALQTSDHPDAGICFGAAARDNELLAWDGTRLLSRTSTDAPTGDFTEFSAVMPALRSAPFAKANIAQTRPDVADNGTIRVATWISNSQAYYSVFDSVTGALITGPSRLTPIVTAAAVRAIPVGPRIHILVADTDTQTLQLRSVHRSTPYSLDSASYGECSGYFDVWKVDDSSFVVAQTRLDGQVTVRFANADGTLVVAKNWIAAEFSDAKAVAVCVHPVTGIVCLVARCGTDIITGTFDQDGTPNLLGAVIIGSVTSATRSVAVAPKWLQYTYDVALPPSELFNVYYDDWTGSRAELHVKRFDADTGNVAYSATKYHLLLGSQAFRVGDRTFVWAARNSTYQSVWMLLDETLNRVGQAEYAVANAPSGTDAAYTPFSVNWTGTAAAQNRSVFHCGLSTRVRIPVALTEAGKNAPAVYTEPYIKFAQLDFLPQLRWAQAGRTTYFAGAQLWAYDGGELTEANFLLAPEDVTVEGNGAGSLTSSGKYVYRVDLCYRNAQNEEVRSASYYTPQLILTSDTAAKLTIPSVHTRRENSYFLIFRNESEGTVWYLCNSRDPQSPLYLKNDQSVPSVIYNDSTVDDAALISREQHPNQSFNHLDPFAAPAAEVIAAGRDRLWLAGGEIPAGQVYPSRLFSPGETPAFHSDIAVQVDRSAEAITAIGFVGEYTVFFRETHNYILDGDGPDNERSQVWATPRRSDSNGIGAVSQASIAEIAGGIVFQSPAGIRMFTTGGGIAQFGTQVDALSKSLNIASVVVVGADQEVRFYGWDGTTLVYNYQYGNWSTWTVAAAGAVRDPSTGLAVVVTPQGEMWRESEGVWTDDGGVYKMRVRFAWLRAGNLLDWQQVRRIGAVGEAHGTHKVHVDVYYNEREFAEEWFDWDYVDTDSQNTDTFGGSGNFGDGNFGDESAVAGIQFRDTTWPWRRRLFRRKCSVISIAIDDNYTDGEGFTLTALALELAKKPGLDRLPWRGGSYTNTGGSGSSGTGN